MTIKNVRRFDWNGAVCSSTEGQCCGMWWTRLEFILFLIGCVTWGKSFTFSEPQTHYLRNEENNTYLQRGIRIRDNLREVRCGWPMLDVQEMADIPS